MPSDGNCFATCSEDGGIHVFDMRAYNELASFKVNMGTNTAPGMASDLLTSLAFSISGRILFVGHSDGSVLAFDVLADRPAPAFTMTGAHERHVACLGVSPSGEGLCTGSWDTTLKVCGYLFQGSVGLCREMPSLTCCWLSRSQGLGIRRSFDSPCFLFCLS